MRRSLKNQENCQRFYDAIQLAALRDVERMERESLPAQCSCRQPGSIIRIDGVDYIYCGGMIDAGCRVHNPCRSKYIPQPMVLAKEPKADKKKNTAHRKGIEE